MSDATPDVCIIGLGTAGATAAYALTNAGMNVLALEAGPVIDERDARPDELYSAYGRAGYSGKFNQETQTWRSRPDAESAPIQYSLGKMVNGVGGSTHIYGAWMRRFQPHDFWSRSGTIARYGESALPPGSCVADWPIDYDDLEPYYCATERMLGVAGIPGNVRGEPVPGGNPFDGYRSEPLPLPRPPKTSTARMFTAAARKLGYHPFPVPAAINTEPYDGRPACTYCGWCTFYVCHNGAKSTAGNTFGRRARESGRLCVRTGCRVFRINAERDGRVMSVDYVDQNGQVARQSAPIFILSTYTFENVRLLLTTTSRTFPRGFGNNTGQVGKYFMTKQYSSVLGLFRGKRLNRFAAPAAQGTLLDDFVGDNFDHTGLGFIRGATLACEEQVQPIGASRIPPPPGVPRWGSAYRDFLLENWNSIADCRVQPETLAYEDAFLDLDPRVRDRSGLGMPVVRVTWDIHENEQRLIDYVEERARTILREMGADVVWAGPRFTGAGSAHDLGGCRMGADRATSVVDPSLRIHDSPNLYIMSGAVFPSGGGINPTLTLQALCWRAADQIAAQWRHGAPLI